LKFFSEKNDRTPDLTAKANEARDVFVEVSKAMFVLGAGQEWQKQFKAATLIFAANTLRAPGDKKLTTMATAIPVLEQYNLEENISRFKHG